MPICTYLTKEEIAVFPALSDPELVALLEELNSIEGECWAIRKRELITSEGIWPLRNVIRQTRYSLLSWIHGIEWQYINFPGGTSSINTLVDAAMVKAYLLGYLGGLRRYRG